MKKYYIIREFVVVPVLLIILCSFVRIGSLYFSGTIATILFPTNNTIIEMMKVFYTSMIFLIVGEYFLLIEIPRNYLLSRLLSLLTMVIVYVILRTMFYEVDEIFIFVMIIFSIALGQVVSYAVQRIKNLKFDSVYCLLILLGIVTYAIINNKYVG